MEEKPETNVLWWAAPAATVLLLALLAMFGGADSRHAPPDHSTYDASGDGIRAVYLLLDGLDYDVAQSRRLGAGHVRWVLFPAERDESFSDFDDEDFEEKEREKVDSRRRRSVESLGPRRGHAPSRRYVADVRGALGIGVVQTAATADSTIVVQDGGRSLTLSAGRTRLAPIDRPDRRWPERGEPIANIFRRGRGEIWIVKQPEIFRNERIRSDDNALVVCRLADATSHNRKERIYFDEFFHGLHERPGPIQLLLQPPVRWVTLQGLGVLALVLWRFLPRFGPLRELAAQRRRSKEEFVDAMAYLLARKGAYAEAYSAIGDALIRDVEASLGLPATPPAELAAAAARRRPGMDADRLERAFVRKKNIQSRERFLTAVHELDLLRREFFNE